MSTPISTPNDVPHYSSFSWQRILKIALLHKRELILAHIIAFLTTILIVPIPLLMPLLVDEVLLDQPAILVNSINWFFPVSWHSHFLTIITITVVILLLHFISLALRVLQMRQFTIIAKDVVYQSNLYESYIPHIYHYC